MTIAATGAGEIWVTHGQEDALVHWCTARGLKARPLDIVGYGDEDEESPTRAPAEGRSLEAAAGDGAAPAFMVDMDTGQSLRGFRNDGGGEEP